MQISILQSLIDRTSNDIAEYEACIAYEKKELAGWCDRDLERVQRRFTIKYYSDKLPKLRVIQKALKKEIAKSVRLRAKFRKAGWRDDYKGI